MKLQDSVVEKVSLIFASQIFHHFDTKERDTILKETYKTLLPGGILIISDTFIDTNSTIG
jgi:predicted SAM-dependent methyltransferase